jgi:hypothetical protein
VDEVDKNDMRELTSNSILVEKNGKYYIFDTNKNLVIAIFDVICDSDENGMQVGIKIAGSYGSITLDNLLLGNIRIVHDNVKLDDEWSFNTNYLESFAPPKGIKDIDGFRIGNGSLFDVIASAQGYMNNLAHQTWDNLDKPKTIIDSSGVHI